MDGSVSGGCAGGESLGDPSQPPGAFVRLWPRAKTGVAVVFFDSFPLYHHDRGIHQQPGDLQDAASRGIRDEPRISAGAAVYGFRADSGTGAEPPWIRF